MFNNYDVNQLSVAKPNPAVLLSESVIPLYRADGNQPNSTSYNASQYFLQKGSSNTTNTSINAIKLWTMSSNWPASTKFYLYAAINVGNAGFTGYCNLYDFNSGTSIATVGSSFVSTGYTTYYPISSGAFTLTPGHSYGVSLWSNDTSGGTYTSISSVYLVTRI